MIALARRKGDVWYAAAMTDNDARDYTLDTKFLGEGEWKAEVFRDGEKSATEPMTYVHENITVKAGDKLPVKMAPGGGFVIKFTK
jgi:alpha-glucosidase